MTSKFHIGCSGFSYQYWKNKFYPKGLAAKDWLQYYSTIFNTVELNGTFYRQPKLTDLKKYYSVTPDDFRFSVKMSRYITHILRLKNSKEAIDSFQDLILNGLEKKLLHFLFQMPPSFQYSEENLDLVLSFIPNRSQNVIEFRHLSWWNKKVIITLNKAKITFCNVDYPGLKTHFMHTSPKFYFRLHGNPELFKSPYSNPTLKRFFKNFPEGCKHYTVYFNNTTYEAGYENALELMKIISQSNVKG
jgi:uncharacterized protein YecE (DUF72 family)